MDNVYNFVYKSILSVFPRFFMWITYVDSTSITFDIIADILIFCASLLIGQVYGAGKNIPYSIRNSPSNKKASLNAIIRDAFTVFSFLD